MEMKSDTNKSSTAPRKSAKKVEQNKIPWEGRAGRALSISFCAEFIRRNYAITKGTPAKEKKKQEKLATHGQANES